MTARARTAVSVVIPVFNAERYLAAAIDSVLDQTRPPDEVIVVDDGSTDATPAVLASFGDRITVISQPNGGGADATNRGVAAAAGDLLCFLDADDLWEPPKLAIQMDWLAVHPETEAVFGHVRQFISEDLDQETAQRLACPQSPQPGVSKITIAIRRKAFDRVGAFDGGLRSVDFVDWFARALDRGLKTEILPDVVALRRLHATNNGLRIRGSQMAENLTVLKRALDRRRGLPQRPI
jgi:glycosyltransferase involved in cell wall biosynthesis